MDHIPLLLGLGVTAAMIAYVEVTLRRENLSSIRARQSIIDRRLLSVKAALDRIERRLDAMTVDREVVSPPSCHIAVNGSLNEDKATTIAKRVREEMAKAFCAQVSPSRQPCLDCAEIEEHTADCALRMDGLVEAPEDAAARRKAE